MGEPNHGKPAAVAVNRSEVRRLRLFDLEHVTHQTDGQEWIAHWHDEWSFGAVVEGECQCSVAGRPFVAHDGDLIAIAPGVVHTGALTARPDSRSVRVIMLYVPPAWLESAGIAVPARSGFVNAPTLTRAARNLDAPLDAQAWLRKAVPAMAKVLRMRPGDSVDPMPTPAVRSLFARVQVAIRGGERTVAGLARRSAVSRERMHRAMKQWIGMTPSAYLRAVRLHRAKQLVLSGAPVASVAAECGFADQAHFTRWFRRTFGYTPGDLARASLPLRVVGLAQRT
jgi:AraC-like DNA-binding protein